MDILLFNLEVAALSTFFVLLHASRRRLGIAPLLLATGVVLTFMMVGGRVKAMVPVPLAPDADYASLCHLSLVLAAMVLVYTVEGTSHARRFIAAIAITNLFLFALRGLLTWHLLSDGSDLSLYGRERWLVSAGNVWGAWVSTVALVVDGIAILVVYQAVGNALRFLPRVFPIALALVVGMVTDGVVFGGLTGRLSAADLVGHIEGKVLAGIAAAIPVALYVWVSLRRATAEVREGVLYRGPFDVLDLRKHLAGVQEALARSRAETQHVKDVFGRYVVPDVVAELLRDTSRLRLGGDLKQVTILFSDIRGYSTLSERMSPTEVIDLLNVYFGEMATIIDARRGTIIEFEGDAILAVFGAPLDQDDHAERAVRTALEMLERVEQLNEVWEADGTADAWKQVQIPEFKIRIGVHSGTVVAGNVGSETRTKYAVIGDTVNITSRVEGLNKKLRTTLLLTDATAAGIAGLRLPLIDLGEHQVKGRQTMVRVFTIDGVDRDAAETSAFTTPVPR